MTFAVDLPAGRTSLRPAIRLDGEWSYLADPRPQGQQATEETVDWTRHFPGRIAVPGCWQAQTGAAAARAFRFNSHRHRVWYRKRFVLPSEWAGRRISLRLGGVLPAAEVWLNGCALGMTLSSRCPVRADVTAQARPGEDNDLVICISRPELRLDGVFEWIVGGWEGIYRSVQLECHGPAWIRDVFVHGDAQADVGAAWIGVAGRLPTRPPQCELRLTVYAGAEARPHWTAVCPLAGRGRDIRLAIPTGDLPRWSPESPALCRAVVEIHRGGSCLDQVSVRFGLRSLCVKGRRVLLNGQPVFLRGCGDNQCYPATVSPPNSVAFFRQRLSQMKSYGFNLVHAYDLFTEEHLQAADEVGMLVMQTLPFGVVNPVRAVRNAPGPEWRRFLRQELDNIVSSQRAQIGRAHV